MFEGTISTRRRLKLLAVSLLALSAAVPALAADPAAPPSTPSLLEAMVASGVITQGQADKILADARARDLAKAAQPQAPQAAASAIPAAPATGFGAPAADGAVHVQYVPEVVKKQLREEIKQEVMAQAKDEGWAAPNQMPEWTQRIRFSGDMRMRFEQDLYPHSNTANGEDLDAVNFNVINTASTPVNLTNLRTSDPLGNSINQLTTSQKVLPFYDTTEDRQRERLRARLAMEADLGDGFTTGMRFGTGSDAQPVSTNQTLGASGGDFSKYSMWLDRGFIKYQPWTSGDLNLSATVGRFDNPFFSTDLIWWDDIAFDGAVVQGRYRVTQDVTPFVTLGAFPVYNTALDFGTDEATKSASNDKWLYGLQAGSDWKATPDLNIKGGAAYYYFSNVEGKPQDCDYLDTTCASDSSRPSFAQKGNTYIALRNNINYPVAAIGAGSALPDYQYFGLATPFRELALTGKANYDGLKPLIGTQALRVSLDGEYVKNLAFNRANIQNKGPENNNAGTVCASNNTTCSSNATTGAFDGGDTGYMARLTVGSPTLKERWDWNVSLTYKYIESDAVVDGFNDPDFGMGGTNLKGYIVGTNLALARNVWTQVRWMSADSISGIPFSEDVLMLDLNAKF